MSRYDSDDAMAFFGAISLAVGVICMLAIAYVSFHFVIKFW
jgi:hypothetical protein